MQFPNTHLLQRDAGVNGEGRFPVIHSQTDQTPRNFHQLLWLLQLVQVIFILELTTVTQHLGFPADKSVNANNFTGDNDWGLQDLNTNHHHVWISRQTHSQSFKSSDIPCIQLSEDCQAFFTPRAISARYHTRSRIG